MRYAVDRHCSPPSTFQAYREHPRLTRIAQPPVKAFDIGPVEKVPNRNKRCYNFRMIGHRGRSQDELFVSGSLKDLIPKDHVLRKVDRVLDLRWLNEDIKDCYTRGFGRPGLAPETAMRLMLAGFLLGIVHDRKLMREAQVNLAIRWFAGFGLHDSIPDHSTLTRIRKRWGEPVFKRVFERIVGDCMKAGLVKGEVLHVDSTLIRANASYASFSQERQKQSDANSSGRKTSASDPDALFATHTRKEPLRPSYKQHTAVDDQKGIIVDVLVTRAEINEGNQLLKQLSRISALLKRRPLSVTADCGYAHGYVLESLEAAEIEPIMPTKPLAIHHRSIPIYRFKYDAKHNIVRCPKRKILSPSNQTETGWFFKSRTQDCRECSLRKRCLSPTVARRAVHLGTGYQSLVRARRRKGKWSKSWWDLYKRHRWQVEGIHGEAKVQHGLNRAVRRQRWNAGIQSFLTAIAINLKRLSWRLVFTWSKFIRIEMKYC